MASALGCGGGAAGAGATVVVGGTAVVGVVEGAGIGTEGGPPLSTVGGVEGGVTGDEAAGGGGRAVFRPASTAAGSGERLLMRAAASRLVVSFCAAISAPRYSPLASWNLSAASPSRPATKSRSASRSAL